jgi:flagella basal body P-ring formation protein FlgA
LTLPVGERPRVLEARLASRDVHPGLVSVPVHAIVDGVRWRTVWTSWTAAVWEERTVLARDAAAGEEISAGMLEVRRLEAGGPAALDASRLVGSSLRRDARSGESLGEGDVLRRRLIEPGAAILLEIRMGGVSARTPATAQEGGARGDRVRVRLREGERSMLATVVSRELVVVDLTSSR